MFLDTGPTLFGPGILALLLLLLLLLVKNTRFIHTYSMSSGDPHELGTSGDMVWIACWVI
jgi:hypothetical protein